MLGIVSLEREGVLTLTASEHDKIEALGIPTNKRGRWILGSNTHSLPTPAGTGRSIKGNAKLATHLPQGPK